MEIIKESLQELKQTQQALLQKQKKLKKELGQVNEDLELLENVIMLKQGKFTEIKTLEKDGLSKNDIPEKYEINMYNDKKILFTLRAIKEGAVKDIADYMHTIEKNSDYDTLYKRAQQGVLRLVKTNKLIKSGDYASKYKLNIIK